jgi:hypothetical protein
VRVVHIINGDCEVFLQKSRDEYVRIRIRENATDNSVTPSDFEIEGNVASLKDVFSTVNLILQNIDALGEESN